MRRPNPRVQRTRPYASLRGSPLTRHLLGVGSLQVGCIGLVAFLLMTACLGVPKPQLVARSGDLASLDGAVEIALYASDDDLEMLKAELTLLSPAIVFTTADNAQVIIHFREDLTSIVCVDCGSDWSPGILRSRFAFATVQRHDDRDHCLPSLLSADWKHEAYSRAALVRAFVKSLAPYLKNAGA